MTDLEQILTKQIDEANAEIRRLTNIIFSMTGINNLEGKVSTENIERTEINKQSNVRSRNWPDHRASLEALDVKKRFIKEEREENAS